LHCHAGCEVVDIVAALGLQMKDLFVSSTTRSPGVGGIVATYDYKDVSGTLLYQVVRYAPKDFRQRCPDGYGGWTWKLSGVPRVLYRLRELQGCEAVVVVEGEKDADALWRQGIPATTNVNGAGKWRDEYAAQLQAAGVKRVRVIPDNDDPGRGHMDTVAGSCCGVGLDARIVTLTGVPPKGDVSDYLDMHSKDDLIALLKAATPYTPFVQAPAASVADAGDQGEPRAVNVRDEWPAPLDEAALHGVFGDIVRVLAPQTEADPTAILVQLLVMFGNVIGRTAHFRVEADTHYLNEFVAAVGPSSKARKGVSTGRAREIFGPCDPEWMANRQTSGLSSGEGLVWAVRDPIEKKKPVMDKGRPTGEYDTFIEDHGVADKRLMVIESELASTLARMGREGNTLSALLRQAWDGHTLQVLTKSSPAKCTGPHISIIANITSEEVRRTLTATETANGFANRILWFCVRRSQYLPDGGGTPDLGLLSSRVREAIARARQTTLMCRDRDASARWHQVYPSLSDGRPGMLGAITARAEAHVMRLACLYALGDCSPIVRLVHLEAALALWKFSFASARFIFGRSLGNPMADAIWQAGRASATGLTRSDIWALIGRHGPQRDLDVALGALEANHLARRELVNTGGRAAERWQFLDGAFQNCEISEKSEKHRTGRGLLSLLSPLSQIGRLNASTRLVGGRCWIYDAR
jgi:hypothetical protein